ncbi:HTH domain-containing protein [Planomonospora parontospora]|uniref:HTH domain-containing protein n=1 Tax=Planomonospora parontospora TaxID=58119 RepID=UPI0019857612|nr:hypothetical protein GCM10014719_15600 [Planomonospora parontospora subsp. antibiotica]GII17824.1 hypothetical protein Ppa05_45500 [Planomonospora parontospora subsp. antibiotica]
MANTSARTLRRDIDRLRELGCPVHSGRGLAGGYRLRSGTAMPPLLLDDFDWPVLILAATGADFDVVHPPEFHRYLRELGERLLRAGSA